MSLWGPLHERYSTPRRRKLLALDGGGIRGVMTLEILAEIERQLAEATGAGEDFRLGHFFDYIGGTSTGAILATGLSLGMSIDELLDFYTTVGPDMFASERLIHRYRNLYRSEPLREQLGKVFGEENTLEPRFLKCLLLVVLRNATTDSPWPLSSNPLARYNDPGRPDCNLRIPLWQLVRASTAAPIYFPPEVVQWDPDDAKKAFVFVDGGMTPYNNPAFLLYRMATLPQYRLGFEAGEAKLMLVSVGTGTVPEAGSDPLAPGQNAVSNLAGLPSALMNGSSLDQDINCRAVGRCVQGESIDREIGDLIPRDEQGRLLPVAEDQGRAFLYARYNCELSPAGLERLGLSHLDPEPLQSLDAVDAIPQIREVGRAVAGSVDMSLFAPFLD